MRDFPYNDFPYRDFPYRGYPHVLGNEEEGRGVSRKMARANPGGPADHSGSLAGSIVALVFLIIFTLKLIFRLMHLLFSLFLVILTNLTRH